MNKPVLRDPEPGHVYLVGAGPGDPGLLTLRAAHLLALGEVLLPDDLVSDEVLALGNPAALVIPVGKRCGGPRITQAGIHALMLQHALAGKSVIRLKSGDPLVFGRANEECEALREAGIPFEIVPGITTAFAVAAAQKMPLTDRKAASRLILATAHHAAGKIGPPTFNFGSTANSTLALYMPGRDFAALAASLAAAGTGADTPVVAVSRASTPAERVTRGRLGDLASLEPGPAPVLLLIGEALRRDDEKTSNRL